MTKNKAAQALGKLGGATTSKAKAAASRENGKLGGRPLYVHKISRDMMPYYILTVCEKLIVPSKDVTTLTTHWREVTCPNCKIAR